jgi:uncharacterized protein (DUF1330 family)
VPGALAAIARFGRRGIAGGGKIDLLESDPKPERIFIIEFPSADAGAALVLVRGTSGGIEIRLSAANGRVFLIEGN